MMRIPLLCCLCLIASICKAQSDTSFVKQSITNVVKLYEDDLKLQPYFNGIAYSELRVTKSEHPYYLSKSWMTGSIDYEGRHFNNVPLRFDIVNNTLITESYNGNLISLVKEKLSGFNLEDHHFAKIDNDLVHHSLPETAFYDVLYDGFTKLIAWREKEMQKTMISQVYTFDLNKTEKLYLEKYRYFVLLDNDYHQVSGKSSILKLLSNQKHALKKFIRNESLDFQRNREMSMALVTAYYDSLMKNK